MLHRNGRSIISSLNQSRGSTKRSAVDSDKGPFELVLRRFFRVDGWQGVQGVCWSSKYAEYVSWRVSSRSAAVLDVWQFVGSEVYCFVILTSTHRISEWGVFKQMYIAAIAFDMYVVVPPWREIWWSRSLIGVGDDTTVAVIVHRWTSVRASKGFQCHGCSIRGST